ncbi:MAG: phosphoglycerate kinase [Holosporaceae bacterium]|jgi:phosphoglycerate kinase|nr:phosphoglycerate kinase [Holosporaceae bacterium]
MHVCRIVRKEDLRNKKVLVRVDFNVPMENGIVRDSSRIKNALPTIKFLKDAGAKIILASHLGKTARFNHEQSLKNIVDVVAREYDSEIIFVEDCLAENAGAIINAAPSHDIILLENLRFYSGEESCDEEFAKRLATLADFYINEAFSVSHRRHASIFALPRFLPHAFGLSFLKEINVIDNFFQNSQSPKMGIVGGAKLTTKVNLLKNLVKKIDKLALGGGIAGVFLSLLKKHSFNVPNVDDYRQEVAEIAESAQQHNCELILPIDFSALVCQEESQKAIISSEDNGVSIFDIGPNSIELFKKHLKESKVLLWNGPVGLFEKAPFDFGTASIAKEVAQLTRSGQLKSIIGGGDTGFAMNKFNVAQDMSYISTAGGAFLSYLEGEELPGILAMKNAHILESANLF